MLSVDKTICAPYTPSQMYDLVNNVEQYPLFLPWCAKTEVHHRDLAIIEATVHIVQGNIQQSFSTRNTLSPNECIHMHLLSGPFKQLKGAWLFDAHGACGSQITFKLQFEFANKLVQMVFGQIFHQLSEKMLQAFVTRAEEIYGIK